MNSVSLKIIQLVKTVLQLGNLFYSLTPIEVTPNGLVVNQVSKPKRTKFWAMHFFLPLTLTIAQLHCHIKSNTHSNVILMIFNGYLVILEIGMLAILLMFHFNTLELCQLLNQLITKFNGLFQSLNYAVKSSKVSSSCFLLFLIQMYCSAIFMFLIMIPLTMYMFPQLHNCQRAIYSQYPFMAAAWKRIGVLVYLYFFFPAAIVSGNAAVVAFVVLSEIRLNLQKLLAYTKLCRVVNDQQQRQNVCFFYRQLQILVIVANKCFQSQLLPLSMFCGAIALILLLYPLLAYGNDLPVIFQTGFATFSVIVGFVTCLFLDQCSDPMVMSMRILATTKQWKCTGYTKKFFRSCPPIVLMVGELHVMNKERVTVYIRFVLQRTALLVMKYKSDLRFV